MQGWERVKTIMDRENLKINPFSKKIGLTNNVTINKILNDKRNPQKGTLVKIADAFPQYSREWIIYGTGEMLAKDAPVKRTTDDIIADLTSMMQQLMEQNKKNAEANKLNAEANMLNAKNLSRLLDEITGKDVQRPINKKTI